MLRLRKLQQNDLTAVVAIEQAVQIKPWSIAQFQSSLARGDLGWVVVSVNEICGFLLLKPIGNEAEILTVAVGLDYQRQGIATALLQHAQQQFSPLFLEVRPSNQAAIAAYEKQGFTAISRRKAYYGDEDAIIYRFDVKDSL